MRKRILVSACLTGVNCKYNGRTNSMIFADEENCVKFCPETVGGLSTPREPAEIMGGDGYEVLAGRAKVVNCNGKDVTREYVNGAVKALDACRKNDIDVAVLKSKSPSCGSKKIYNGKFRGILKDGLGVTAALLSFYGIKLYDENNYREEI